MKHRKPETNQKEQTKSSSEHKPTAIPEVDRLVSSNFGAVIFLTLLPLVLQYAWFSCNKFDCSDLQTIQYIASSTDLRSLLTEVFPIPSLTAVRFIESN